ncbi:MAG: FAD-dependent oxidoreductase [Pirellulaceae bacterium]
MLTTSEVVERTPLANPHGLLGGMASDTELRANPRIASARVAAWLHESLGVTCQFNTTIVSVADREVVASDGRRWQAERVVICSGSDLRTLYPEILAQSGLKLCKLQMFKAVAQIDASHTHGTSGSPHLASGLTLRHYSSFRHCPALESYERRIATDHPELNRYGIHLMASQLPSGEVILGDSHEYDDAIQPFDKPEIDALMLREARKVFQLQDWTIDERWHGVYAKHPTLPIVEVDAEDRVHISVGPGGAGMTMSFGLAERMWRQWMGETE